MNILRKTLTALAITSALAVSVSTSAQESITNAELRKVVEEIKLEIAQHVGVQAYYDEKVKSSPYRVSLTTRLM